MKSTSLRLLAATLCTVVLVACGGGGGGGSDAPPIDQTPPTLSAQGSTRAVVRKGDTAPLPAAFTVAVGGNPSTGTVAWRDEAGAARGSGNTLALNTTATALTVGEHTLTASITNPANGRSAETSFTLLVLAEGANTDDNDNDGLTYDEEKTAGTEPGNGDTDGDGLADGAEADLGTNPTRADSDANGVNDSVQLATTFATSFPARSLMADEAGKSAGVRIEDDGLSITFGDELNAACVNKTGPFTDEIYAGPPGGSATDASERCRKRAVRANVGVQPGEFRYFETRRIDGLGSTALPNIGQGIITPSAQIDPYCCFIDAGDADYTTYVDGSPLAPTAANITPPSMTVNAVGGVFARLVEVDAPFAPGPLFDLAQTQHYGFAVDYRGANPLVYVVMRDSAGDMIVSKALDPGQFGGAPAMPMLHGHPVSGAGPHAAINLGLQKFHYTLADVRAAITARGGDAATMAGGVGIHRW